MLNEIAKLKKPIILSTGLSSISEIKSAIKIIKRYHNKIILLYCISGYPTPLSEINFNEIKKIKNATKIKKVGFSDHTSGIEASLEAISRNVYLIERHFTLKRETKSPDVKFSIIPEELKILKNYSLSKKFFSQTNKKKLSENHSKIFRRSIYAIKNIKRGEKFTSKNIDCFRPNIGYGSENYFKIINKRATKNINKFEVLRKNSIRF